MNNGSFEEGLTRWRTGRALPTDPNADGSVPVDSDVWVTDDQASDGERSLALFVDGRQAEGTLWVEQPTDLTDAETLAVDYYSEQESFNTVTKAAVYAGPVPDQSLTAAAFDTTRPVEDHAGWQTYEYDVDQDGLGLVAVGITVAWETEVTRYLDNVRLR